jgi:hypothetical protein
MLSYKELDNLVSVEIEITLKFSLRHLKDFSRCAIVTDTKWFSPLSALAEPFIDCELAYFPPEDLQAARDWLFWPEVAADQI